MVTSKWSLTQILTIAELRMRAQPDYRELGRRLRVAREAAGLSQRDVADHLGIEDSTYSRYESGKLRIPLPDVYRVARFLGVKADDLLAEREPRPRRRTPQEILRELEASTPILVPETTQPAAAGPGVPTDAELWPYFPEAGERGHEFIAVPVKGTCMEPRIPEGARVVVDKTASPRPGDIVLAIHEGEAIVKMLTQRNGHWVLTAIQGQPPIEVDERTQIVGVVRYWGMRP